MKLPKLIRNTNADSDNQEFKEDKFDDWDSTLEDFDFDDPLDTSKRKPKSHFKDFSKSLFKSALSSIGPSIREQTRNKFPNLNYAIDDTKQLVSDMDTLKTEFIQEVQPAISSIKSAGRQLTNNSAIKDRISDKLYEKLNNLFAEEEKEKPKTKEEIENESINESLSAIFEQQAKIDQNRDKESRKQEAIKESLNSIRHKQTSGLLNDIRINATQDRLFRKSIYIPYLKKDLELKYKHLFVAKETLGSVKAFGKIFEERLKEIAYNSSLPDVQKATRMEKFKETMIANTASRIQTTLGGIFKQYVDRLREKSKDASSNLNFMASMLGMAASMPMGMGMSPASLLGDMAGKFLTGRVGKYVANKYLADGTQGSDLAKLLEYRAKSLPFDLQSYLAQNRDRYTGSVLGDILDILTPSRAAQATVKNKSVNPTDPAQFDQSVKTSIVSIIPGYLARILQQTTNIATGKNNELLLYDHSSNGFVTRSNLRAKAVTQLNANLSSRSSDLGTAIGAMKGLYSQTQNTRDLSSFSGDNNQTEKDIQQVLFNLSQFGSNINFNELKKYVEVGGDSTKAYMANTPLNVTFLKAMFRNVGTSDNLEDKDKLSVAKAILKSVAVTTTDKSGSTSYTINERSKRILQDRINTYISSTSGNDAQVLSSYQNYGQIGELGGLIEYDRTGSSMKISSSAQQKLFKHLDDVAYNESVRSSAAIVQDELEDMDAAVLELPEVPKAIYDFIMGDMSGSKEAYNNIKNGSVKRIISKLRRYKDNPALLKEVLESAVKVVKEKGAEAGTAFLKGITSTVKNIKNLDIGAIRNSIKGVFGKLTEQTDRYKKEKAKKEREEARYTVQSEDIDYDDIFGKDETLTTNIKVGNDTSSLTSIEDRSTNPIVDAIVHFEKTFVSYITRPFRGGSDTEPSSPIGPTSPVSPISPVSSHREPTISIKPRPLPPIIEESSTSSTTGDTKDSRYPTIQLPGVKIPDVPASVREEITNKINSARDIVTTNFIKSGLFGDFRKKWFKSTESAVDVLSHLSDPSYMEQCRLCIVNSTPPKDELMKDIVSKLSKLKKSPMLLSKTLTNMIEKAKKILEKYKPKFDSGELSIKNGEIVEGASEVKDSVKSTILGYASDNIITNNFVSSNISGAKSKVSDAVNVLNSASDAASSKYAKVSSGVKSFGQATSNFVGGGFSKFSGFGGFSHKQNFIDIYSKEILKNPNADPLITAAEQETGEVVFIDGKPIHNSYSIDRPVIDKNGNQKITKTHIKQGIFDRNGNDVTKRSARYKAEKAVEDATAMAVRGSLLAAKYGIKYGIQAALWGLGTYGKLYLLMGKIGWGLTKSITKGIFRGLFGKKDKNKPGILGTLKGFGKGFLRGALGDKVVDKASGALGGIGGLFNMFSSKKNGGDIDDTSIDTSDLEDSGITTNVNRPSSEDTVRSSFNKPRNTPDERTAEATEAIANEIAPEGKRKKGIFSKIKDMLSGGFKFIKGFGVKVIGAIGSIGGAIGSLGGVITGGLGGLATALAPIAGIAAAAGAMLKGVDMLINKYENAAKKANEEWNKPENVEKRKEDWIDKMLEADELSASTKSKLKAYKNSDKSIDEIIDELLKDSSIPDKDKQYLKIHKPSTTKDLYITTEHMDQDLEDNGVTDYEELARQSVMDLNAKDEEVGLKNTTTAATPAPSSTPAPAATAAAVAAPIAAAAPAMSTGGAGLGQTANQFNVRRNFPTDTARNLTSLGTAAATANSGMTSVAPKDFTPNPNELGKLSSTFESGKLGTSAIGYDPPGGTSYGRWQIASNTGTMKDFLRWLPKHGYADIAQKLSSAGPLNTGSRRGAVPDMWKKLATEDNRLHNAEYEYIKGSHYDPVLKKIKDPDLLNAINSSRTLQDVVWSTGVAHGAGGGPKLINRSYKKGQTVEEFLTTLYAARANNYPGQDAKTQASLRNRYQRELALALGGTQSEGIAKKPIGEVQGSAVGPTAGSTENAGMVMQTPPPEATAEGAKANLPEGNSPTSQGATAPGSGGGGASAATAAPAAAAATAMPMTSTGGGSPAASSGVTVSTPAMVDSAPATTSSAALPAATTATAVATTPTSSAPTPSSSDVLSSILSVLNSNIVQLLQSINTSINGVTDTIVKSTTNLVEAYGSYSSSSSSTKAPTQKSSSSSSSKKTAPKVQLNVLKPTANLA